jgi:hypothetical protein
MSRSTIMLKPWKTIALMRLLGQKVNAVHIQWVAQCGSNVAF